MTQRLAQELTFVNDLVSLRLLPRPAPGHPLRFALSGTVVAATNYARIVALAAAPGACITSDSGSTLPHPNPAQAFDQTPNEWAVSAVTGTFEGVLDYPNAYYTWDGTTRVPPTIFVVMYKNEVDADPTVVRCVLDEPFPLRTLTHRPERAVKGPAYYNDAAEVFGIPPTQEALLRARGTVKIAYGLGY